MGRHPARGLILWPVLSHGASFPAEHCLPIVPPAQLRSSCLAIAHISSSEAPESTCIPEVSGLGGGCWEGVKPGLAMLLELWAC